MAHISNLEKALNLKVFIKLFTAAFSVGSIGNESKLLNEHFEKADDKEAFLDMLDHALVKLTGDTIPEPVIEEMRPLVAELNGPLKDGQIQILKNFIERNRKSHYKSRNKEEDVSGKIAFEFLCLCDGIFLPDCHDRLESVLMSRKSPVEKIRINNDQTAFWSFIAHYAENHWHVTAGILIELMINSFEVTVTRRKESTSEVTIRRDSTSEVDRKLIGRIIGGTSKRIAIKDLWGRMSLQVKEQDQEEAEELFYTIFQSPST